MLFVIILQELLQLLNNYVILLSTISLLFVCLCAAVQRIRLHARDGVCILSVCIVSVCTCACVYVCDSLCVRARAYMARN